MSMLSLEHRIDRAAQLVVRSKIFYDLWHYFESIETRGEILATMQAYPSFFRMAPHAFLLTFVVQIAALFEARRDTINFSRLLQEMVDTKVISKTDAKKVEQVLSEAKPLAKKLKVLRNNVFAHRTAVNTYDEVFEIARITPEQIRELIELAMVVANGLLAARGLSEQHFYSPPKDDAIKIMSELKRQA